MFQMNLLELQAELAQHKANLATLAAEAKRLSFLLDDKSGGSSPRRRHFKSITQVKLPDRNGDIYFVFLAVCEEGRAWRKNPDTDEWEEVTSLPDI
jgi:hypothetical protein